MEASFIPLPKFLKKINLKEILRKKLISILVGITCLFMVSLVKYSGLIELILSNFTSGDDLSLFQSLIYGILFILSRGFVGAILEDYIDIGTQITMTMDNGEPSQEGNASNNAEEKSRPSRGSSYGTGSSLGPNSSDTTQESSTYENPQKDKGKEKETYETMGKASKNAASSTRNRFIQLFNKQEDFLSKQLSALSLEESKTEDELELSLIKEQKEEIYMQMKMLRDSYLGEQKVLNNSEGSNLNNLNKRSLEDSSDNVKDSKKRGQDS